VSEGFLQRPIVDFSRHSQKYFSRGDKSGKISIYPLETKKTAFFAKHLIGKCQISNSREGFAPPMSPPSYAHDSKCTKHAAVFQP